MNALFQPSKINKENGKAQTLPILNFKDKHVKNFHLSWFGFFIAFFAWFAFPPLIAVIKKDLKLTTADVLNSNVLGLTSTLLVRIFSGHMCDKYGPRKVMALLLFSGAISASFVFLVKDAFGLLAIRFFIGFLGGTFVPCQVWTTVFFDKNIVGTANGIAGGWGNAGGGAVFYIMPAVFQFLIDDFKLDVSSAWRWSFIVVPVFVILVAAVLILVLGDDCPQGDWANRYIPPLQWEEVNLEEVAKTDDKTLSASSPPAETTFIDILLSPQTYLVGIPYACTFGAELAVEGVISEMYIAQSKLTGLNWTVTIAGRWASMFGLLNFFTRPLGGVIADLMYKGGNRPLKVKKFWLLLLGLGEGLSFVLIGFLPTVDVFTLIVINCFLALFMEVGNGANYALVPHIHPTKNGYISGLVGAFGNLGGIFFSLLFRFNPEKYFTVFWINGIIIVVLHLMLLWIPIHSQ